MSLRSLFFSLERQKGVDLDGNKSGEELRRAEGGKTILRTYYERKNLLSIKRKIRMKLKFFIRTQTQLAIIISKTHQAPANTSLLLSCNKKIIYVYRS